MNGNFENMIRRYSEELMKMSKEKTLPDLPEENLQPFFADMTAEEGADDEEADRETTETADTPERTANKNRESISDISGIERTEFYREATESFPPFSLDEPVNSAYFSARVFTGNNAYPIENARVLVTKDDKLFSFLSTDSNGITKKIKLPSYPEANSLNPESNQQYVEYKGEVYAKGFTPKKDLLISAVGGSDIVLDVQMTPEDERVK